MRRDELPAGDVEALAALTSQGLVRRAARMLESGSPELDEDSGGARATFTDGSQARLLRARPLGEATCSCGAPTTCRHVVALVLAMLERADAPPGPDAPPAIEDDEALKELVGARVFERASAARCIGVVAEVEVEGGSLAVRLPTCTVRIPPAATMRQARCGCASPVACEHLVLAAWAAREFLAGGRSRIVEIRDRPEEAAAFPAVDAAARGILLRGVVGSADRERALLAHARTEARDGGATWLEGVVDDVERALEHHAARSARYAPEVVAGLLVEARARVRASSSRGAVLPPRFILGRDEPRETRLDQARLVGLGARVVADGARRHAEVVVAHEDGTALVIRKTFDAQGESGTGPMLARRSVAPRMTLGHLAGGTLISRTLKRSAARELLLGASRRGEASLVPQAGDWSTLRAPLLAATVAQLEREEAGRPPQPLRPRHLGDAVHVLAVASAGPARWDASRQVLTAQLADSEGSTLTLERAHRGVAPHALAAIVRALESEPRFVSGHVRARGRRLVLDPLAIVTARGVVVPDLDATAGQLPFGGEEQGRYVDDDPHADALALAGSALAEGAHLGLAQCDAAWRERIGTCADELGALGLETSARDLKVLQRAQAIASVEAEAAADAWFESMLTIQLTLDCV